MNPKVLDKIAKKLRIGKYAKSGTELSRDILKIDTSFSIDETDEAFVLENLSYKDGLYHVEWHKELLIMANLIHRSNLTAYWKISIFNCLIRNCIIFQ